MFKFVLPLVLLASCAGWQGKLETVLVRGQEVAVEARQVYAPIVDSFCAMEVDKCNAQEVPPEACEQWQKCNHFRKYFADSAEALLRAVKIARTALDADDVRGFEEALLKVMTLAKELGNIIEVIKGMT